VVLGVLVAMLMSVAVPAMAEGKDEAPAQICKENGNTWEIDDGTGHPFAFTIQSDGGCASSVAHGFDGTEENFSALSTSAFNSQCKFLEDLGVVDYPYAFYGNPDYLAKNRADCRKLLYGFHNGLLVPGPGGG
jgi:hypothetical protein